MENDLKPAGAIIRRYRIRKGLSLVKLGAMSALSPTSVMRVELGEFPPGADTTARLIDALEIEAADVATLVDAFAFYVFAKAARWQEIKEKAGGW